MATAIRRIGEGLAEFFDPILAERFQKQKTAPAKVNGKPARITKPLSAREGEILQLIAEGEANKQIAVTLNLSIKTVEKHRQRLMNKLQIHNTAGLTRYALTNRVIEDGVQV